MAPVVWIGMAVGAAIAAAVAVPTAIIQTQQAKQAAKYKKAIAEANAKHAQMTAEQEAKEMRRSNKFLFGSQRATAAAMGLGFVGTSVEEQQQMDIGLATLEVEKKLYEGDLAWWQAENTMRQADYEARVAKYDAWMSAGTEIVKGAAMGAIGGAAGAGTAAVGATKGAVAMAAAKGAASTVATGRIPTKMSGSN